METDRHILRWEPDTEEDILDTAGDDLSSEDDESSLDLPELYPQPEPQRANVKRWVVCFSAFLLNVPFMGMVMSFGELLLPLLDTFGAVQGTTAISWVGSIAFGMAYVASPLTTLMYSKLGCRKTVAFGVLLGSLALFITSFVENFWFMFVTYSLMFGLATNLTYNPPIILTGEWFPPGTRFHVLSTAFVVSGIPFGSLVMNPICESLVHSMGIRDAYRTLSVLVMVVGLPCSMFMIKPPEQLDDDNVILDRTATNGTAETTLNMSPNDEWLESVIKKDEQEKNSSSLFENLKCNCNINFALWTDSVFMLFMLGQLFKGVGYIFPFIHLISYMDSVGIPSRRGAIVLTLKGAGDMVGRLLMSLIGDRLPFNLIHIYVITCAAMAITTYYVTFAKTFATIAVYGVLIGIFNGIYNSGLFPTTTSLFPPESVTQAWAFVQVPPGIAIIIGPGMAGAIYDSTHSYAIDFYVNILFFTLALITFVCIPGIHIYRRLKEKGSFRRGSNRLIEMSKLFSSNRTKKSKKSKKKKKNQRYSSLS